MRRHVPLLEVQHKKLVENLFKMGCVCGAHERNSSLQELLQSTAATELRSNLSRTKSRTISISESILNGLTPRYSERNGYSNRGGVSKEFLDNHQYTKEGILTYEKVFGHNFVSPGGITTTTQFVAKYLHLEQGQKVLDVGCGIGGSAFHMAFKYGVNVLGIDLSSNMIEIANERLVKERMRFPAGASVGFELCDATKRNFPENSFDVIYSRDTILHIRDKQRLFEVFCRFYIFRFSDYRMIRDLYFLSDVHRDMYRVLYSLSWFICNFIIFSE